MSVNLSACISLAITGQTFLRLGIGELLLVCQKNPHLLKIGQKYRRPQHGSYYHGGAFESYSIA